MIYVNANYSTMREADEAIRALLDLHVVPRDLRVMIPKGVKRKALPLRHATHVAGNTVAGGIIGVLAGAAVVASGLMGVDSSQLADVAVRGAMMGGAVGVLGGALRGLGRLDVRPKSDSESEEVRTVNVGVLTLPAHVDEVEETLRQAGGVEIHADMPTSEILAAAPARFETPNPPHPVSGLEVRLGNFPPDEPNKPEPPKRKYDAVEEAGHESFPASDAPSYH